MADRVRSDRSRCLVSRTSYDVQSFPEGRKKKSIQVVVSMKGILNLTQIASARENCEELMGGRVHS